MCLKRLTKATSQAAATTAMLSSATTAADAAAARAVPAAVAFTASQELGKKLAMAVEDDLRPCRACQPRDVGPRSMACLRLRQNIL